MENINNTDITNQVLDTQPVIEIPTPSKQNNIFRLLFFISIFVLIAVIVIGFLIFKNYTKEPVSREVNNTTQTREEIKINPTVVKENTDKTLELNKEPISYSNENNFQVSKKEFSLLNYFNASELETFSKECETNKSENYFKNILSKFTSEDKGYVYEFTKPNSNTGVWKVIVIPNKITYTNLSEFKNDFDLCLAGGERYPNLVSDNYLLFISSCSTGYASESADNCDYIRKAIEPTLKLN